MASLESNENIILQKANDFIWLTHWYLSECNGLWEDMYGVYLATTQEKSWHLSIDLKETFLEEQHFNGLNITFGQKDFILCSTAENIFHGYCSPLRMFDGISVFKKWADNFVHLPFTSSATPEDALCLDWFSKWCCDILSNDFCCLDKIKIHALENPGWNLSVKLTNTGLEHKNFSRLKIERSEHDWLHCFVEDGIFRGPCGPFNFFEVIAQFRKFAD